VRFLQAVAAITLSKTRTRLNLKKLYAADGAAVRELLKLAQLLHKATHTVSSYEEVRAAALCRFGAFMSKIAAQTLFEASPGSNSSSSGLMQRTLCIARTCHHLITAQQHSAASAICCSYGAGHLGRCCRIQPT
jgi:hypothetical protein